MNTEEGQFADVRVRRAVSLAINREQLNGILFDGAGIATIVPFPLFSWFAKIHGHRWCAGFDRKIRAG